MNHRVMLRSIPLAVALALACSQIAFASPPKGVSGFQFEHPHSSSAPMPVPKESPKEAAMGGIERLGVLEPLFGFCHTPNNISAPFIKLERLMEKTAVAHKVATRKEVVSWEHMGESQTKTQWQMAKEKGVNVAGSCIAVEMELTRQAPLVTRAIDKLRSYANENLPAK